MKNEELRIKNGNRWLWLLAVASFFILHSSFHGHAQQYATVPYVITAVKLAQRDATNWVAAQNYCTSCNISVSTNGTAVGYVYGPATISTNGTVVGSL